MIILSDKIKLYCDDACGKRYKVLSINANEKTVRVEDKSPDNKIEYRRFSMDRKCGCTTKVYLEIEE